MPERKRSFLNPDFLVGDELEKAPVKQIGGKAFNLVRLRRLQDKYCFVVPDFAVIPAGFWQEIYQETGFEARAEALMAQYSTVGEIMTKDWLGIYYSRKIPDEIVELHRSVLLQRQGMIEEIHDKVMDFGQIARWDNTNILMMRSSSPLEKDMSFAGVFLSKALFGHSEFYDHLDDIALSPWSAYAEFFYRRRGLVGQGLRKLPIVVQKVVDRKQVLCSGTIFFGAGMVEIQYHSGLGGRLDIMSSGDNMAVFDGDKRLVSHDRIGNLPAAKSEFLSEGQFAGIIDTFSKAIHDFPEFGGEGCFEFSLNKDGAIHAYQARRTGYARDPIDYEVRDLDPDRQILKIKRRGSAFTPGNIIATIVNLLNTKYDDLPLEKLEELDKQYPGAMYLVRLHSAYYEFGDRTDMAVFGERHYITTSRKKAVVTCTPWGSPHDHVFDAMVESGCSLFFGTIEDFWDLPTGLQVRVVSSTEEAVFYRTD